ncbi:uncharacterized protein EI97DRAFT_433149 [Westerdykella ornata]|uniref:Uncharacterized protein n=1 Tax=Westerdykella ornata TaxID=318751 RepID=A0A6A6JIC9_WESOR|nr:uncharacterized protein EI97DRAFT_433149 [Westerdykella ornata]KAF2276311.1 hypothetical protein EI97DRAFT_433149 [Westerdykella ornata]
MFFSFGIVLVLHLCHFVTVSGHSGDHAEDRQTSTSTYTGPTFNPTEALNYASTGSLDYHLSTTTATASVILDLPSSTISSQSTTTTPSTKTSETTSQGNPPPSQTSESIVTVSKTAAAHVRYACGSMCGGYAMGVAGLIGGLALV